VLVLGLSMSLVGILDVLGVVLALEVLDAGDQGVGLISGAMGAGGLLGAGIAISLVGRHRLLTPMLLAAVVVGLGIGASGLVPLLGVALLGFLAGGIGKSVFDVAGRTMLQRVAPDATLARIFGVLEGVNMAALALGTLAAPILVQLLGTAGALVVAGSIVPAAVVVLRPYLARADTSGIVHEEELGLIRAIPMFAPLRVTALEHLAQELDHMHVRPEADIIRQGDTGDRFYIIGQGQCAILVDGRAVNVIGPGAGFGEIALLNDVPRTATVRSITEVELFVLDRAPFLEAVTGQPRSRAAAQAAIDEHLEMNRGGN
jgi:MFS family permease